MTMQIKGHTSMARRGSVVHVTISCNSEEDARLLFAMLMMSVKRDGTLGGVKMLGIQNERYVTEEPH